LGIVHFSIMSCLPRAGAGQLVAVLFAVSALPAGCAGAQTGASTEATRAPVPASSGTGQTDGEPGDSLANFRKTLAGGLGGRSELNLAAKGWGPGLGTLLGESAALESLIELDVSDNDLGVEGARALARSTHLLGVRDLELGGNDIGDDGAIEIAHAEALAALETLNVSANSIGGLGAQALLEGGAKKLSSIDLSMNAIGGSGASALGRAQLPLTALYLLGCEIGPNGMQELTRSKHLGTLRVLALSGNDLGDAGAQELARAPGLANLTTLDLCANGVSDIGALALAQSPYLKKLMVLELFGNEIGPRGAAALKKRFAKRLHI
jgi:Ran GTPase-activating protein (RanGAP) involved in mRNA processing and transport